MPCQQVTIKEKVEESTLSDLSLVSCNVKPKNPKPGETVEFTATIKNNGATPISIVPRFAFGIVGIRGTETSIAGGGSADVKGTLKVDKGFIDHVGPGSREVSVEADVGEEKRTFPCGTITVPSKSQSQNKKSEDGSSDSKSGGGMDVNIGEKVKSNKKLAASAGLIGLALLSKRGN